MPEDVISINGLSEPLMNGQEAKLSVCKPKEEQIDSADPSTCLQLMPENKSVHQLLNALQEPQHEAQSQQVPRDRANSMDNQVLRSLFTHGAENWSRGVSSASSVIMSTHAPPHSALTTTNHTTTPSSSLPTPTSSRSTGLLYSLLVSADSRPPSSRLKQPLAPSSAKNFSTSEAKKHKLEEPAQKITTSEFAGLRRFSFSGDVSHAEELKAYIRAPNGLPKIPINLKSIFDRRFEENVAKSMLKASTFPYINASMNSILSALIVSPTSSSSPGLSSTSTDSGLDEPLDLTPRKTPNEPVQLAKKTASPVQRRISEFLRSAAEFVHSNNNLPMHWWDVFKAAWHRLLILAMAEDALDLVLVESPHAAEHLAAGEPVLPWLNLPSDPTKLVPTRAFAERVLGCISEIRKQKLSSKEFKTLRNVILFTATQPTTLAEVGVKTLQKCREAEPDFVIDNGMAGALLYPVTCGLIALETLPMAPFAGLFCSHLRGEASKDIFSDRLRASIQTYSDPEESILVRLVCETPQPKSKEAPVTATTSRIFTSTFTSIPPKS